MSVLPPISSSPPTPSFNIAPTTVTFSIPAGVWTSATWDITGDQPAGAGHTDQLNTYPGLGLSHMLPQATGAFSETGPANGTQLVDINTAAGGLLSVDISSSTISIVNVSVFTLTLTGTPVVTPTEPVPLPATSCPIIQIPSSIISIENASSGGGTAVVAKNTASGVSNWDTATANPNAAMQDVTGRMGGFNVHAVDGNFPPALSTGPSLALAVSNGQCSIGGPVQPTINSVVVPDNTALVWIWLSNFGALTAVATDPTPPDGEQCLLGSCTTYNGAVTNVSTMGVLYIRGGSLHRETEDAFQPADIPPGSVSFYNKTDGGLYHWDGSNYYSMNPTEIALTDALTAAQQDILDLQNAVRDLINQLVAIGLDDILAGQYVAAEFELAQSEA